MRYHGGMPSCPSCGAERAASAKNAPCAACGAMAASGPSPDVRVPVPARPAPAALAPDFQLDVPKRPPPKPVAPRKVEAEVKLELAVEPRNFAPIAREASAGSSRMACH